MPGHKKASPVVHNLVLNDFTVSFLHFFKIGEKCQKYLQGSTPRTEQIGAN